MTALPLIGEVTTNRPPFSSPSLVFSCDREGFSERTAHEFSGNSAVKPCDQSPVLLTLDRYETCFPKGDTKLLPKCHSAETVLGHLSAAGKSHREGGENLKWPFPTYPVEGRVSFQSPLTCCFQSSFLCRGPVNKLAICYWLLRVTGHVC